MTRIGLLGDVHGNMEWMKYALNKFNREGITTVIQVGDFGIWPGDNGALFLKRTNLIAEKYGIQLLVAPGNHDDYDQINAVPVADDGWQHLRKHIWLAPRGHRVEIDGASFVFLGGAPSVDRWQRTGLTGKARSKAWWPEEMITREDVDRTVAGGYADVMIAHDAPFVETIQRRIAGNPHGFKREDIEYAYEGRKLIDEAFLGVHPRLFVHGHYHFPVDETVPMPLPGEREVFRESRVLGLDCDNHNFSLGHLETDDLSAELWDIRKDRYYYFANNLNLMKDGKL